MIWQSFTFEGIVGRRAFLFRLLGLAFGMFGMMLAEALVARALMALTGLDAGPTADAPGPAQVAASKGAAVLLCLWTFYALAAKRLRSIGLEPALVIPVSIAVGLYEDSLFRPAFGQAELFGYWASPVGHVWDLLFFLVLALWPERASPQPAPARHLIGAAA